MKNGVMRITAHGHEEAGVALAADFLHGLRMKNAVIDKILPIVRDHLYAIHNPDPTDKQLQKFALRLQPANIRLWDLVSRCDSNGRGGEYMDRTKSYALYERSLELSVSEAPVPHLVSGGVIIERLDMKPGPDVSAVREWLYDAQLDGAYADAAGGLAYAEEHTEEREAASATAKAAREIARQQAAQERDRKTAEVRALPKAERRRIAQEQQRRAAEEKARIAAVQAERARQKELSNQ
jgi:hypothetical protein